LAVVSVFQYFSVSGFNRCTAQIHWGIDPPVIVGFRRRLACHAFPFVSGVSDADHQAMVDTLAQVLLLICHPESPRN
jgi:hypothetical protein